MDGRVKLSQVFFTRNREGQVLKCFHCSRDLPQIRRTGLHSISQTVFAEFSLLHSCAINSMVAECFTSEVQKVSNVIR